MSMSTVKKRKADIAMEEAAAVSLAIAEAAKAFGVVGTSSEAEEAEAARAWQAKVREQKEMQLLEGRIREAARMAGMGKGAGRATEKLPSAGSLLEGQQLLGDSGEAGDALSVSHLLPAGSKEESLYLERLREYEELAERYDENFRDTVEEAERNGGVIDGGTWEHRKRAKEMLETARKNLELTVLASGAHHLADFLPQEELDKFLKRADAITSGSALPIESDFEDHKLDESNIGFQMLKRAGWTEGESLGSTGSGGVLEPLNMGGQSTETTGLGVQATHEVAEGDNEFDQYRKRMMLAYRFRPNPLNNPRRNYY